MPAEKKVTVAVRMDEAMHAAWKADAERAGVPLQTLVMRAVEDFRGLPTSVLKLKLRGDAPPRAKLATTVDPAKCTARVRAGSYCRRCAAIHTKGF